MRKIIQYVTIDYGESNGLDKAVNERLKKGWELYGSISVSINKFGTKIYCQPMVVYAKPQKRRK